MRTDIELLKLLLSHLKSVKGSKSFISLCSLIIGLKAKGVISPEEERRLHNLTPRPKPGPHYAGLPTLYDSIYYWEKGLVAPRIAYVKSLIEKHTLKFMLEQAKRGLAEAPLNTICAEIFWLWLCTDGKINEGEAGKVLEFIKQNRPKWHQPKLLGLLGYLCLPKPYFWPPGMVKPRVRFLDFLIRKLEDE